MPLRFRSNGRLARGRIDAVAGDFFLRDGVHHLHRMHARAGGAGHHHVGAAAHDRAKRLADRRIGRRPRAA